MPVKLPIVTASDEEMSQFDSSDSEEEGQLQTDPVQVDWLSLSSVGCEESLGICALPGCRFKETWRSLDADLEDLKAQSIRDIFVLCTRGELHKYRVPRLLERYEEADFTVHHHPFPDGTVPAMAACVKLLDELKLCLSQGKKTLIHCSLFAVVPGREHRPTGCLTESTAGQGSWGCTDCQAIQLPERFP
ncbi:cyclin-dependent kinase inhibitor 3-like isoform X2 [Branchiostoma floridae x Branchiostoma belcheri]